jgi:hypothetical protein
VSVKTSPQTRRAEAIIGAIVTANTPHQILNNHRQTTTSSPDNKVTPKTRSPNVIKSPLPLRRLLTLTTAFTMALPALPAFAQDAAPPARVGQIAAIDGSVSFDGSGSGGWAQASLNYPVTSGDTLYTQDGAGAAIALDSSKISLAADTELQVTGLDATNFAATQSQGEVVYAIDGLQPGQQYTITTPRGTVGIAQNGEYDVLAGDANDPTTVSVFQGAATVTAPGATQQLSAGQAAYLSGTDQTTIQLGQAQPDRFTNTVLAQNAPAPPAYAPPVVQQMTGTTELSQYGSWNSSPQYGAVWYPSVSSGWAPYRNGYWANVPPWGWTWVESEPWGFAPFHYGRWVDDGNRWGWAPAPAYSPGGGYGPQYQPVYAPAVVSFFGVALAAGITAAAFSSGSVGWVPLGPNEPYYPSYRASPAYIRQINYVNVRNINTVNVTNNYYGGNFAPDKLANRRGATYVPADVMSRGEHVGGYAHPAPQAVLAAARPVDPGFGGHPAGQAPAGQAADFRLPEPAKPLAQIRPGTAPRPTEFAQRRELPPATVSHAPFTGHPGAPAPHEAGAPAAHEAMAPAAMQPAEHETFATAPGFHPPPAPPKPGEHLATLPPPPKMNVHPASVDHAMPQAAHPETPAYHPPAPPPQNEAHPMPAAQAYHPPAEAPHPAAPAFHPQPEAHPMPVTQAYHPPVAPPPVHPAAVAPHPAPPPPPPHPEPANQDQHKKPT